ncbi:acetolactate synthase large subunit [Candidatus Magnetomorum sp. HK-1]|nr:acetolactate synthase large subunit [Candidatus Magnetomorum sp. HK-1]
MKKSGAELALFALEQIGVKYTFGIPGVHNTELYDALNSSSQITPILVTHEGGAAFMADAVSRTSGSIGTLVVVPAAGITHAMSGIGEAFLDGIPMLVITGGVRRDSGKSYQLHQVDHKKLLSGVVKKVFLTQHHRDIIPSLYEAYEMATSGTPGPVFIEIPSNILLFRDDVEEMPQFSQRNHKRPLDNMQIKQAVNMLKQSDHPGLYLGWGAVHCSDLSVQLAELLETPVSTTLQGLSSFPASHPLHTGMGFGPSAVPAAQKAFANCDCLIAAGLRFSELATGSYGLPVPENLIHIDINSEVFDKNYPSKISIQGDTKEIFQALIKELASQKINNKNNQCRQMIEKEKGKYQKEWAQTPENNLVSPYRFFQSLKKRLSETAYVAVDDGNHTFLTMELMPIEQARHFISPSDFNCMGYCVPAAIATKLCHPDKQVVGIVGDGAFLMTCMEIITASIHHLGVVFFVFHDGELGQISQFQSIPLNRKTCTILGDINIDGIAKGTGAAFLEIKTNRDIDSTLDKAFRISESGQPVIVDVNIDYSKKSCFTKGVVKTNLGRFPIGEKVRFIGRAIKRHILG